MSLLAIAAMSLTNNVFVSFVILAVMLVGLTTFVVRRIIEKTDLLIFMIVTLLIALAIEGFGSFSVLGLLGASPFIWLVFLPVMGGLGLLAASILFLLIYRLLEQIL